MSGVNGTSAMAAAPDDQPDAADDFWHQCHLRTTLTVPPMHELVLPGGQRIEGRTALFFSLERFVIAFIDATGSFPPLPKQGAAGFLRERFEEWLRDRQTVAMPEEASEQGTLVDDILLAIAAAPETDDPANLVRGGVLVREDGTVWLNARMLLERVRHHCPVRFTVPEFYRAMAEAGCKHLGMQRSGHWLGRVWAAPRHQTTAAPALPPSPQAGEQPQQPELIDESGEIPF